MAITDTVGCLSRIVEEAVSVTSYGVIKQSSLLLCALMPNGYGFAPTKRVVVVSHACDIIAGFRYTAVQQQRETESALVWPSMAYLFDDLASACCWQLRRECLTWLCVTNDTNETAVKAGVFPEALAVLCHALCTHVRHAEVDPYVVLHERPLILKSVIGVLRTRERAYQRARMAAMYVVASIALKEAQTRAYGSTRLKARLGLTAICEKHGVVDALIHAEHDEACVEIQEREVAFMVLTTVLNVLPELKARVIGGSTTLSRLGTMLASVSAKVNDVALMFLKQLSVWDFERLDEMESSSVVLDAFFRSGITATVHCMFEDDTRPESTRNYALDVLTLCVTHADSWALICNARRNPFQTLFQITNDVMSLRAFVCNVCKIEDGCRLLTDAVVETLISPSPAQRGASVARRHAAVMALEEASLARLSCTRSIVSAFATHNKFRAEMARMAHPSAGAVFSADVLSACRLLNQRLFPAEKSPRFEGRLCMFQSLEIATTADACFICWNDAREELVNMPCCRQNAHVTCLMTWYDKFDIGAELCYCSGNVTAASMIAWAKFI